MDKILYNEIKKFNENKVNLVPLIPPQELLEGAPMNPSIGKGKNGDIYCTIRTVNYVFYHSRAILHPFGVLNYLHPENDMKLRTWNLLCDISDDLSPSNYRKIDTSLTETYKSVWDFVGHEDVRLFEWDDQWYLCGIRRDLKKNGESRMELCKFDPINAVELDRMRIPAPGANNSYCEKNWMPIISIPNTFIKWSNPVEVVKFNQNNKKCDTISISCGRFPLNFNLRGSSQVIDYENGYLAVCHSTMLWKNEVTNTKDGKYRHYFVKYNSNFELEFVTEAFSFLNGDIEFATGMIEHNNNFVISFGYIDNSAFLIEVPKNLVKSLKKVYEHS